MLETTTPCRTRRSDARRGVGDLVSSSVIVELPSAAAMDAAVSNNARQMLYEGRRVFRDETSATRLIGTRR
jgi:hypothetical protein